MIISNSFKSQTSSLSSLPLHYRDDLKSVLIPYGLVQDRIEALASRIFSDLRIDLPEQLGRSFGLNVPISTRASLVLVCLCVLKGGYRFFSDLVSKIQNENRFVELMPSINSM